MKHPYDGMNPLDKFPHPFDPKKTSECCKHPIYTDNKGNNFCSQCLKDIKDNETKNPT